jgi:hypothetical protein
MEYGFSIDVFTPETLPLKRLAQYLAYIAALYGHSEHVHFQRVDAGSAVLVAKIDDVAIPNVKDRLLRVEAGTAPVDALKAWDEINQLLRKDNACGKIIEDAKAEILIFPGRNMPSPDFKGTITQSTSFEGIVVGILGIDSTKHIHLDIGEEKKISGECSAALARELKNYLYEEQKPIRLQGQARYGRTESGKWEVKNFAIKGYEELQHIPLTHAVTELRQVDHEGWKENPNAWLALLQMRHEGDALL